MASSYEIWGDIVQFITATYMRWEKQEVGTLVRKGGCLIKGTDVMAEYRVLDLE